MRFLDTLSASSAAMKTRGRLFDNQFVANAVTVLMRLHQFHTIAK